MFATVSSRFVSIPLFVLTIIAAGPAAAAGADDWPAAVDPLLARQLDRRVQPAAISRPMEDRGGDALVDVWIVLEDADIPRQWLTEAGVVIRTDLGGILTADAPADAVALLAGKPWVRSIEASRSMRHCLDASVPDIRANAVWDVLGAGNRGAGTVVGVIDSGIDYRHGDFRSDDGRSRVLAIWDQLDSSGPPPAGFQYGTLWGRESLDQNTCTHVPRRFHGTHVAGIAAGDGSETGNGRPPYQYVGVAPDASLLVANHEDNVRDTQIVDAVNWMIAEAAGRPLSVNMSFTAHYGPHDGSHTLDRALSQMVGPGIPGRVICAAAGNEGDDPIHAKTVLTGPSNGYYPYLRVRSPDDFEWAVIQAWVPASSSVSARLWVPADESASDYVITNWVSKNSRHVMEVDRGIFRGIAVTVDARRAPNPNNTAFNEISFVIEKNGTDADFAGTGFDLEFDGAGTPIEAWIAMAPPGVGFAANPNDALLIQPDSENTVGTPASAENVIGVASYVTKNAWTTVDGNVHEDSGAVIGEIAITSARGPMANGIRKPDLAAPGQYVAAAWETHIQPDYGNRRGQSLPDGKHFIDQGTSMASPHACGAAALLMQKNPSLDAAQIKQILIATASDRGAPGWDGRWGAGKLDVLAAWNAVPFAQAPTPAATPSAVPVPVPTPVPTVPVPAGTPLPAEWVYGFGGADLAQSGWKAIPGGFTGAPAGSVQTGAVAPGAFPDSGDLRGLILRASAGQVAFAHALEPLRTDGGPVILRAVVRADRPEAALSLAALKGNLSTGALADGSIGLRTDVSAAGYNAAPRAMVLMYQPDAGEIVTPAVQAAASPGGPPVSVIVERLEIYRPAAAGSIPGRLLMAELDAAVPATPIPPPSPVPWASPTPSPLPPATNTPPPAPTRTPTLAPTPTSSPAVQPTFTHTPAAPTTLPGGWRLLAGDPAGDTLSGGLDIAGVSILAEGGVVRFRVVFHQPFASDAFRRESFIEIFLDTDGNPGTGDESFGAEYSLSAGTDFLETEYAENLNQWSDPTGFGLWDLHPVGRPAAVSVSGPDTLEMAVNLADIGNPASLGIAVSSFNMNTFDFDECPDGGPARWP